MTDFDLSLDRFAWCWQSVSTEEARYYLQGVYVEPREQGGVYMVATDGHVMAVAVDERGRCAEPAIIAIGADFVEMAKPHVDENLETGEEYRHWPLPLNYRLQFDTPPPGGSVVAKAWLSGTASGMTRTGIVTRIDGRFPDWRQAVKATDKKCAPAPGPIGTVDPALLSRLSYRGGGVMHLPRSGVIPKNRDQRRPGAVVIIETAPWACGFLMSKAVDAWADYGDLARELLTKDDLPANLGVWP